MLAHRNKEIQTYAHSCMTEQRELCNNFACYPYYVFVMVSEFFFCNLLVLLYLILNIIVWNPNRSQSQNFFFNFFFIFRIWTFLWHILLTCISTIDPLYLQLPHLLVCPFANQSYPENFIKFRKGKFEYAMHQQLFTGHFSVIKYYKQSRDDLKYSTLTRGGFMLMCGRTNTIL